MKDSEFDAQMAKLRGFLPTLEKMGPWRLDVGDGTFITIDAESTKAMLDEMEAMVAAGRRLGVVDGVYRPQVKP